MLEKISKIIMTLSLVLTFSLALTAPIAMAGNPQDTPAPAPAPSETPANPPVKVENMTLKEQQFEVTKYLDLGTTADGKDQQAQAYFKAGSPTVAFIVKVIEIAIKIAGTLAVVLMIGTGLAMVLSQGNQNVIEKTKQMFLYEILGLVMIFTSYVLVTFVQSILTTT